MCTWLKYFRSSLILVYHITDKIVQKLASYKCLGRIWDEAGNFGSFCPPWDGLWIDIMREYRVVVVDPEIPARKAGIIPGAALIPGTSSIIFLIFSRES